LDKDPYTNYNNQYPPYSLEENAGKLKNKKIEKIIGHKKNRLIRISKRRE